ncbi:hypothetical protein F1559_002971 [Cyanidiococcus yangmingshanensis]|uniref:Conserved Oligomeric Golgi complex subunit 6 C-terminal domain-containing protein n=1 Tax=Cyanidiococcus yangmingshanensis TaxID=2690220 RepID=A0A7J7IDC8_9RHOD|nr:hypothetical protein F1559_002971 [Cyanidiococcus yangmingshanensis]
MQSWKLISDARKRVQRVIEAALERVRAWVHTLDWTEDESPTRGPVSAILKIVQFWPQVRTECLEQIVQGRQRVLLQELQQQWDVDVRAASRRKNSLPTEDRLRLINDLLALVHQRLELECERWAQVFGTKRAKMAESSELTVINQDETNASGYGSQRLFVRAAKSTRTPSTSVYDRGLKTTLCL